MEIINSLKAGNALIEEVKIKLQNEKFKSIPKPHLVFIQIGDGNDAQVRLHKKLCKEAGIDVSAYKYILTTPVDNLKKVITRLSLMPTVTGIRIIHEPLEYDVEELIKCIDPVKNMCNNDTLLAKAVVDYIGLDEDPPINAVTIIGENKTAKELSNLMNGIVVTRFPSHYGEYLLEYCVDLSNIIIITDDFKFKHVPMDLSDTIIIDLTFDRDTGKGSNQEILEKDNSAALYVTPITISHMVLAEVINSIYLSYEEQFDFIWRHCQSLKIAEEYIDTDNKYGNPFPSKDKEN